VSCSFAVKWASTLAAKRLNEQERSPATVTLTGGPPGYTCFAGDGGDFEGFRHPPSDQRRLHKRTWGLRHGPGLYLDYRDPAIARVRRLLTYAWKVTAVSSHRSSRTILLWSAAPATTPKAARLGIATTSAAVFTLMLTRHYSAPLKKGRYALRRRGGVALSGQRRIGDQPVPSRGTLERAIWFGELPTKKAAGTVEFDAPSRAPFAGGQRTSDRASFRSSSR
jgi:hypothetical protein